MVCSLLGRWGQLGGCVFGLGGAGHAAIGVHPSINIGLKVEDAATFYELWAVAVAAHHGQSLVRKAGVLRGIACIHAAIRVSDYFDGLDLRLRHDLLLCKLRHYENNLFNSRLSKNYCSDRLSQKVIEPLNQRTRHGNRKTGKQT